MDRVGRLGGRRLPVLLSELHAAAQHIDPHSGPQRGRRFEQLVQRSLLDKGFPVRAVAGGVEILGTLPASGLRHQIDAEITCREADVIGEWKAYRAPVPKNELMLFKAKTDDIFEAVADRKPFRPVYRVFGVSGAVSPALRIYAARHGIAIVDRDLWPSPVLADPLLNWPNGRGPSNHDLIRLRYLYRPLQSVYRRAPNGGLTMPPRLATVTAEALLAAQAKWSKRLDDILGWQRETA